MPVTGKHQRQPQEGPLIGEAPFKVGAGGAIARNEELEDLLDSQLGSAISDDMTAEFERFEAASVTGEASE